MNIQAEKLEIMQWLAIVNDSKIIRHVMMLKRSSEEGAAVNLSQEEKDAVNKGLESMNEGRFTSHEEVMATTRKKYGHLFK